jgi:hypothetical protein
VGGEGKWQASCKGEIKPMKNKNPTRIFLREIRNCREVLSFPWNGQDHFPCRQRCCSTMEPSATAF